jgi:uroporphyrinogen-III synthase
MKFAMQQNKINILSTRPLQQEIIDRASAKSIYIETISFIETERVLDDVLQKNIVALLSQKLTVVFTSMNAVEAVAVHLNHARPDWKIFCIGSTTKKLVKEHFGINSIAGTADSAGALADVIIASKDISSVTFFCGNQRREELPDRLSRHGIELKEFVVYKTIQYSQQTSGEYDAIIFYSPSAVNSFFSINKINQHTILFAIGHTTAKEIKKHSNNKIIIAAEPSKELLVEQALNYFELNPIYH